ncbi:MAG TPA: ThuA domain-containing protein [Verrucomicrobiales bacterium]|nr:ThuA domain-containing protein [Verrucomicrobiales bacterium]
MTTPPLKRSRGVLWLVALLNTAAGFPGMAGAAAGEPFRVLLRDRVQDSAGESVIRQTQAEWDPARTAVIVCDMWDAHHCLNATRRVAEMAPRVNAFLKEARERGALIVHAPSSCMEFYANHPARRRAQEAPAASNRPEGIDQWLYWIDEEEEAAGYPVDASDGGEDDGPEEHAQWAARLTAMGRNPDSPWIRQSAALEIDEERDAVTDSGVENWNLLEERGADNVFLIGVHTNMCVLGRPFGLRQLAKSGKNVALVRDLTDAMYDPEDWPRVSHYRGTELVVEHIERHVCPTVASNQVLGGEAFRFPGDTRKAAVLILAEDEYETQRTLPRFFEEQLGEAFRMHCVFASPGDAGRLEGLETLEGAGLLVLSVRRRALPEQQMRVLREYLDSGGPVVGVRTASHAFSLRGQTPEPGRAVWEEFDPEVLGGNYQGHYGNEVETFARVRPEAAEHAIVRGLDAGEWPTGGSLYRVSPLEAGAEVLLWGRAGSIRPEEPAAWTYHTAAGGRVFYTSLGHPKDFESAEFQRLLTHGILWAAGQEAEGGEGRK